MSQVHTIIKFKGSMITIMKVCIAYLERQYRKHKTENDGNDILEAKPKFHLHFILAAWVFRSFSPSPTFFCTCTPLESSSGFTPCTNSLALTSLPISDYLFLNQSMTLNISLIYLVLT